MTTKPKKAHVPLDADELEAISSALWFMVESANKSRADVGQPFLVKLRERLQGFLEDIC